jgi:YVTN family beta-propeller protein
VGFPERAASAISSMLAPSNPRSRKFFRAYVVNKQSDDVSVVDIASLKEVARIPVGFNPARNTLWMAP